MKSVHDIQHLLNKLKEYEHSLEHNAHWQAIAKEIVQKLTLVRQDLDREGSIITPPCSTSNSSIHSADSELDTVYTSAYEAFEQKIFSRCVRLVEAASRDSPVDMCLISLAHQSYGEMVTAAETAEEAVKFARWWAEFLDSVEAGRSHDEKTELLEYEIEALQRIVDLSHGNKSIQNEDVQKLSQVIERSYEFATILYKHYNLYALKRLLRLALFVADVDSDNLRMSVENHLSQTLCDRTIPNQDCDVLIDRIQSICNNMRSRECVIRL